MQALQALAAQNLVSFELSHERALAFQVSLPNATMACSFTPLFLIQNLHDIPVFSFLNPYSPAAGLYKTAHPGHCMAGRLQSADT